ncbi:MAG: hypothetical protein EPO12_18220 [Aquabacterium sp.]|jgi:hypothetical protein|nr:MAG: hypothetical protein EPO12_18220 [Aquabacterium sp.]
MKGVPGRYRGVWQRRLLQTPDGRDETSFVRWLQTGLWHADLRLPAGAHEAAQRTAFCGITEVTQGERGEVCAWRRHDDFQPPGLAPDEGWMVFETPQRVVETGVHGDYLEVWERLGDSTGRSIALADGSGPGSRLLLAGRWLVRVRPRRADWPDGTRAGDSLRQVLQRHPAQARALLDFEISYGRLESGCWRIEASTLDELAGTELPCTIRREADGSALVVLGGLAAARWQVLEWDWDQEQVL